MKTVFTLLLSSLIALHSSLGATARQPNIVFILADDLGWADLPAYGNRFNEAPNLNRLAADGMRFTNAYAAAPVCSPTRASIMSGQYPARVGVIDWIPGHWRLFERVTVPKNRTQYPVYHHDVPAAAVRQGPWKLIENLEAGGAALYHLGFDLGETTDLSAAYPEKAKELRDRLKHWQAEVGAKLPQPNPAFDPQRRDVWGIHPDSPKK